MSQRTEAELNAEFSISIVKTSGNPAMDVSYEGDGDGIASALLIALAELTASHAKNVSETTERAIEAFREKVQMYVEMGREQ